MSSVLLLKTWLGMSMWCVNAKPIPLPINLLDINKLQLPFAMLVFLVQHSPDSSRLGHYLVMTSISCQVWQWSVWFFIRWLDWNVGMNIGQVLSNWKWPMSCPSCSSSALVALPTVLSSGFVNKNNLSSKGAGLWMLFFPSLSGMASFTLLKTRKQSSEIKNMSVTNGDSGDINNNWE